MIILMDDFLIRATLAGLVVAAISGPLGAFVVWRRMAYFGATLSHSALLGIGLGLLLGIAPIIGIGAVGFAIALMLALGSGAAGAKHLGEDTLLGIFAHGALALGLVMIALIDPVRFDLMAYLFGDILAVSTDDLILLSGGGILLGGVLLVTSLLIIPAATARSLSRSPHQMAMLAAVCGGASVIGGLAGSYVFDTPSGPSIVVAAMVLFAFSRIITPR